MIFKKSPILIFAGFLLCLLPLMIPSCTHDPVGIELLDTVCYSQVKLILDNSCGSKGTMSCHDQMNEGFSLSDTNSIKDLVKAGDPKGSKLYQVITDINGENFMPPDQPLSKQNRTIIEVWIAQGGSMNNCKPPVPVDTTGGDGAEPLW